MKDIKVAFVDVDNTLLDFNACAKDSMIKAGGEMGITLPDNVMDTFLPINNALWAEIEKGTLTLKQLHEVRWNKVLSALGKTGDGIEFEKRFKSHLQISFVKVKQAEEFLRYLSCKYLICVASNGPYEQQRYRLEKAGLLDFVDFLFVSETVGVAKPSPKFFDHCFDKIKDFKPSQCIMIGDSLSADIEGAKKYGLKTCWFDYYNSDKTSGFADYKICNLLEIKNIL